MTRRRRQDFAGAFHHVTSRGVHKRDIYFSVLDRLHWLNLLEATCRKYSLRCVAYCQMGNHFHVVLQSREGQLAKAMGMLNSSYAQYINQITGAVGHAFQGRYHAELIDRDAYLLEVIRYVLLNPVRARLVDDPGHWPWSSYRLTLGIDPAPEWLDVAWVLRLFGAEPGQAAEHLRSFVLAGIDEPRKLPAGVPDPAPGSGTTDARGGA
jgi:putative transposase